MESVQTHTWITNHKQEMFHSISSHLWENLVKCIHNEICSESPVIMFKDMPHRWRWWGHRVSYHYRLWHCTLISFLWDALLWLEGRRTEFLSESGSLLSRFSGWLTKGSSNELPPCSGSGYSLLLKLWAVCVLQILADCKTYTSMLNKGENPFSCLSNSATLNATFHFYQERSYRLPTVGNLAILSLNSEFVSKKYILERNE